MSQQMRIAPPTRYYVASRQAIQTLFDTMHTHCVYNLYITICTYILWFTGDATRRVRGVARGVPAKNEHF